jgi:SGNH domain (fused to AT3 domains)
LAIKTVILHAAWARLDDDVYISSGNSKNQPSVFSTSLMRTLEALHQRGIRVFIIKDAPNPNFDVPTTLAKSLFYDVNLDIPTKESFMNENRTANELFETDEVQSNRDRHRTVLLQIRQMRTVS